MSAGYKDRRSAVCNHASLRVISDSSGGRELCRQRDGTKQPNQIPASVDASTCPHACPAWFQGAHLVEHGVAACDVVLRDLVDGRDSGKVVADVVAWLHGQDVFKVNKRALGEKWRDGHQ